MKKMPILLLLLLAALLLFIAWLSKDVFTTEKPLPVFKMSGETGSERLLLIRREWPQGNLLLKKLNDPKVYRYEVEKKSASEVGREVWHGATGKVTICDASQGISAENEIGKYRTYGKYALVAAASPSTAKTAIVSAYGPKLPNISVIPFLGGGHTVHGQRYLEIKETANYRTIGKPVRVAEFSSPQLCWTDDENMVVLFEGWNFRFSVLDLNFGAVAAEKPSRPIEKPSPKPDLSRLTGVVRDYGIDEDGDGLYEKIAVEVETETSVPGKYSLYVGLKSANDKHFGEAVETDLKGGIETTRLLFDANQWFDEKIEGALQYDLIDLSYGYGTLLDRRQNSGRTSEYKLSQFKRPQVVFTGENKVTPVDRNRNGKYEGLEIEVGVDVLQAGEYKFQGDLYDELSTVTSDSLIEFGSGQAVLAKGKGKLRFFFSGKKIIAHGVSGKFRLRHVVVYREGSKGDYVEQLLWTEPFDVGQFESEN